MQYVKVLAKCAMERQQFFCYPISCGSAIILIEWLTIILLLWSKDKKILGFILLLLQHWNALSFFLLNSFESSWTVSHVIHQLFYIMFFYIVQNVLCLFALATLRLSVVTLRLMLSKLDLNTDLKLNNMKNTLNFQTCFMCLR